MTPTAAVVPCSPGLRRRSMVVMTSTPTASAVDFFAARLAHQTDPADLAHARATGSAPLVVDVRSEAGWARGRIPGAVHVPLTELAGRIGEHAPSLDAEVVVYCWGPGCNGSTRAGLVLATAGYSRVKELVGGFEYWVREGFAVVSDTGRSRSAPDPLTAPV